MDARTSLALRTRLLLLGVGLLLGWMLGSALLGAMAGLLLVVIRDTWSIGRLAKWLQSDGQEELPEASGLWGDVFDGLHKLHKGHQVSVDRLKAVVKRIQDSTSALQDAVVMIDSQGCIEWWNPAASRLLGFQRAHDQGQPIFNLVRDPRFARYFERREYSDPLELASPSNRNLTLQFTLTEFGRSERLLLARDVTRLKQLERTRQDFVANASHELRTPLTVMRGYLETLLDHAEVSRWRRPLEQMEAQARRMDNLVTDLLLLSRLESTDRPIEELPVDLNRLLQDILQQARELEPDKQVEIGLAAPAAFFLLGEERELHSALSNLIFNAVKYNRPGGQVRVETGQDEQGAYVTVIDTGPGIESRHLPRLTERFYRVDKSHSSQTGGTGLGLAIVKHVLLRHGGELRIASRPGQGSRFTCRFPAALVRNDIPQQP